jgi:hypothetical protein
MTASSRLKVEFGSGTYFSIVMNEALDVRVGIWVIEDTIQVVPFTLIDLERLINLPLRGELMTTMVIRFRRME